MLYALRQLETQSELVLVDRSEYRLRLTQAGLAMLFHAERLLAAERAMVAACSQLRTGWEPTVRVVFDGIYPIAPLLEWIRNLARQASPTRVSISAEFLGGVEDAFERSSADYMLAVLPPRSAGCVAHPLAPVRAMLVAHRGHPLAAKRRVKREDLEQHVLLTVRGSDPRLTLPTSGIAAGSTVHLNDFDAKRAAILEGIGYGWLPEHVGARDLSKGRLVRVRFEGGSDHVFQPHLYYRADGSVGRAGKLLRDALSRVAIG